MSLLVEKLSKKLVNVNVIHSQGKYFVLFVLSEISLLISSGVSPSVNSGPPVSGQLRASSAGKISSQSPRYLPK